MTKDQFIQELLAAAQEAGIYEAEAYYHQSESMRAMIHEGEVEEYALHNAGGLSLRGLVEGKMGMAYTEAFDHDAVIMLVRGVLESANLVTDLDEQFIFAGSPAYAKVDALGDLGAAQERIDLALSIDRTARSIDPRVKELAYACVQTEHEAVRIVNTHGLDLRHEADYCLSFLEAVARDGEKVSTSEALQAGRFLSGIDAGTLTKEAVEDAIFYLDAAPCESGEMPVLLRNTAMSDLLATFTGVFSADAAQKGMSLLAGKEGEMIADPCVTLVDDPLLPGALHSRAFDAEGVATHTKNLVENGKLNTLLHNLKTAKKAGCASTGNAARGGYSGPVGIAPFNFTFKPGDGDLAALQAQMNTGLVITEVAGLHSGANAISGDFSLLAKGYLVENGKPGHAVEQVTVAGNFYQLLRDIQAVGNDARWLLSAVCSPSVLVRKLSVAGK